MRLPDVVWILKTACNWTTEPASEQLDLEQATDLIANGCWHVAVRSRDYEKCLAAGWLDQFTVRSRHKNGAPTELEKIMKGYADWLFYGFFQGLEHRYFYIINLMAFREAVRLLGIKPFSDGKENVNTDGKTFFRAFDVRRFHEHGFPICFKEGAC